MSPANRSRRNDRQPLPIQRAIHSGPEESGIAGPGSADSWAETTEPPIRRARAHQFTEDPVAAVAQLMRWLTERGKPAVVRPGQLRTVIALTGQLLEAMDIQPARTSDTFQHDPVRAGIGQEATGVAQEHEGTQHPHGSRPEFNPAEWDAFSEALRLGTFDAL